VRYITSQIASAINSDFSKKYKAFSDFDSSGKLWDECMAAVRDATLMNHIIFCNDVHEIPPAVTFLRVLNRREVLDDLNEFEKRSIGAFWGFVFKFVFGYRNQRNVSTQSNPRGVSFRVNTVKSATYFYDVRESVDVSD
jgi:hypothetical protein